MNKKHYLFTLIMMATAMLVTSCQKEEGTVTLGAEIKNSVYMNQKVYISDHTPCWHNGDRVNINGTTYSIVAASGTSAQIPEVTRHDTYRAIFPASIVNSTNISSNSSISVTLPSVQYFQMVGNHQRVDVPMGAYMTSGSTLQFYNLCSVVRVTVSNSLNTDLSLSSIILHAGQARLSGTGTVTVTGAESNSIRMNSNSSANSHTVSLVFTEDAPATVDALGSSTFDIVVPAFTTDDIEITINTTDGQYYVLPKNNVGLTHNTITTVTANITELNQYPTAAELISGPAFNNLIPSTATSVEFLYETPWVVSGTLLSTSNSAAPIYGNLEGNIWRVSTPARTINANTICSQMFKNKNNLQSINFNGLNTSNVTNMSSMFEGCTGLSSLNLLSFNTSNVTNMSSMFEGCSGLSSLDFSSFNTSNVTNMSSMFEGCSGLSSLNLSSFNTSNVTNTSSMFEGCSGLSSLDFSSFNTSNVTNMSKMFKGCSGLSSLNLSSFNTSNVTNMSSMFEGCAHYDYNEILGLSSINLSSFNTSNVTNMSKMFKGCYNLSSLNLSNFNTQNVTNMSGMFQECYALSSLNLSNFNTQNVTDMSYMFCATSFSDDYGEWFWGLSSLDLSNFNTSSVTNMSGMFQNCYALSSLNLSNFNTQNVTNMSSMFSYCVRISSLNLSNFNTQNVTNMSHMFENCFSISSLNLSNFNTQNVTNMSYMFDNCVRISSLNLSNFNMSNVTSKTGMCYNLSIRTGDYNYYNDGFENNACTITCPLSVQTAMQSGTGLPSSDQVTFTWVRP